MADLSRSMELALEQLGLDPARPPDAVAWREFLIRVNRLAATPDDGLRSASEDAVDGGARSLAGADSLRSVATSIAAGTSAEEIFEIVAREITVLLGAGAARVIKLDGSQGTVVGAWGRAKGASDLFRATEFEVGEATAAGRAQRSGLPSRVDYRVDADATSRALYEAGFRTGIAAPVMVLGALWGAVVVMVVEGESFPDGASEVVSDYAELTALAIAQREQVAVLEAQSQLDPLTGLRNCRAFYDRLQSEVATATRHERPVAVVVVDIDLGTDDPASFGPVATDELLIAFSTFLESFTREGDLIARTGTAEFAWLMRETDAGGALAAVERVRTTGVGHDFSPLRGASFSAGICDLPRSDGSAAELYRLADTALYEAKRRGRGQSVVYGPEAVAYPPVGGSSATGGGLQSFGAVQALARAVDARDPSMRVHSERVADLAARLAERLGWLPSRVAMVRAAALVHDVGKVAIGEALLGRPDALARQDLEALRDHAVLGATIVEAVLAPEQARWVRHHHEHWDGNGYPDRLVGSAIPDGATIIAVADAWDAMTSDRPGVPARDPAEALHECIHGAGGRFAPGPVDALIQLWREGVLADWHRPALGDVYRPAA